MESAELISALWGPVFVLLDPDPTKNRNINTINISKINLDIFYVAHIF